MGLLNGQTIVEGDFKTTSAGAGDSGKVPKLNASGLLDGSFGFKFGGSGADSALAITSGATNIDLGGARIVIKNYTSISITGTGSLTFTNPHAGGTMIILKSQGNVTLTSSASPMIVGTGLGVAGGASKAYSGGGPANGNDGTDFQGLQWVKTNKGVAGTGTGSAGSSAITLSTSLTFIPYIQNSKYPAMFCGAGGGSGSVSGGSGTGASGKGGNGGASIVIECAGYWNFTTSNGISVAGEVGGNGVSSSGSNSEGGGGGGGGGFFLGLYNLLTANSGTINISGGIGGNLGGSAYTNGGGSGGGGYLASNGGTTSSTGGAKTGGDGGAGYSLVTLNTEFT